MFSAYVLLRFCLKVVFFFLGGGVKLMFFCLWDRVFLFISWHFCFMLMFTLKVDAFANKMNLRLLFVFDIFRSFYVFSSIFFIFLHNFLIIIIIIFYSDWLQWFLIISSFHPFIYLNTCYVLSSLSINLSKFHQWLITVIPFIDTLINIKKW